MVNWRGVLHTSGRILSNLLDNHDRDIDVNSTRIGETLYSLRKLQSRRARMSDKHKIFKINREIGELNTRLGNLKDEN